MIDALKMVQSTDQLAEEPAAALTVDATAGADSTAQNVPVLEVAEPITLQRAKAHLRVVDPDEDDYISSLITAARQMAEGRLNRTIVQRQRVARFGGWHDDLVLFKPPVISVDAVGYLDDTGGEMLLDPGQFFLPPFNEDELPRVELRADVALPVLPRQPWHSRQASRARQPQLVRVYYAAGYPVGQVPAPIIQWMLLSIGTMYDNRATVVNGVLSVPLADEFAKWLLQPFMVYE